MKTKSFVIIAIICLLLSSCSKPAETYTVKVAGMTGPTMMGLVKVMDDSQNGLTDNDYEFSTFTTADMFIGDLITGKYDIASIPAIMAAKLNIKTNGNIRVVAINTLGVLYVVSKGVEIDSISDLKGKTVYTSGASSMQEYTLQYLFAQSGLDYKNDVDLVFKTDNSEIIPILKNSESCIAVLPEPFISKVISSLDGVSIQLSLSDEWQRLSGGDIMITSVVVTRKDFADSHPDIIKSFLKDAKNSVEFVNGNYASASELIGEYGIFDSAAAQKALPNCNIVYITGDAMRQNLKSYFNALYNLDNNIFGGIITEEILFYED